MNLKNCKIIHIMHPQSFSYSEKSLDATFIGQLELFQIDDYNTPKAGTVSKTSVVRSSINKEANTIKFVSYVPKRYGTCNIPMDGSVGIYGNIVEKALNNDDKLVKVVSFYLRLVTKEAIKSRKYQTSEGYYIIEGYLEIDDIVYNQDDSYTFPVYYYVSNQNPYLLGISFELPIPVFNHYVKMRDLWYRDYNGCKAYHPEDN